MNGMRFCGKLWIPTGREFQEGTNTTIYPCWKDYPKVQVFLMLPFHPSEEHN